MANENASLMPFYTLTKGQKVRFTALDATSGADVSAVVISKMVIAVDQDNAATAAPSPSPLTGAYTEGGPAV